MFRTVSLIQPRNPIVSLQRGVVLGQTKISRIPRINTAGLTREQIVRTAANLMIKVGNELVGSLSKTYEEYKGTGNWWLAEAAAAFFYGNIPGIAFDVWWQASRANEAVAKLQSINMLANQWVLEMTGKWLPAYNEEIYALDESLGEQVGATFDRVIEESSKIVDALVGVRTLPPRILAEAIGAFWGSIKSDIKAMGEGLVELLNALGELTRAVGAAVRESAKAAGDFPKLVVLGGIALIVYLIAK